MKIIKRLYLLVLATIMMTTILALPVSAEVGGLWAGKFKSFDRIQRGSTGNFVGALQRYLMSFDDQAKSLLSYKNAAGQTICVDCDFGRGTDDSVRYVQTKLGCKSDGYVWENTWEKIELDLDRFTGPYGEIILKRSLYNPNYVYRIISDPYVPNSELLCYYNGSNTAGIIQFA